MVTAGLLSVLISLLILTSAAEQQLSAVGQLEALVGSAFEGAVSRALAGQQRCDTEETTIEKSVLPELRRLRDQLDEVIEDIETRQKSAPACEEQPIPLQKDQAPFQKPAVRACARSCLQLRDHGGSPQDGVYWFTGMPVPVLCDFSHDGGGWTLLLTAVSRQGWDLLSVLGRNELSPSLEDNYSILRHADAMRDLGRGGRFAYRIETQAETGRLRWGGIWLAPRHYSFVDETGSQTEVRLVRRFDRWVYKDLGIEQRMPWLRSQGGDTTVLTTNGADSAHWWGTMVTHPHVTENSYRHSPWIEPESAHSGTVLYWMREQEIERYQTELQTHGEYVKNRDPTISF